MKVYIVTAAGYGRSGIRTLDKKKLLNKQDSKNKWPKKNGESRENGAKRRFNLVRNLQDFQEIYHQIKLETSEDLHSSSSVSR